MNQLPYRHLPAIPHAGYLGEQRQRPAYLEPDSQAEASWPFYTAGQAGEILIQQNEFKSEIWGFKPGYYLLRCYYLGQFIERKVRLDQYGSLETTGLGLMAAPGSVFLAELEREGQSWTLLLREESTQPHEAGYLQKLQMYRTVMQRTDREIQQTLSSSKLSHLRVGMGENRSLFPMQLMPSVLDVTGRRISLHYGEALERLADLLLAHRPPFGRTLVYADQSVDLFGIFALQEVGRLLGIRNLTGSSIWGAQAVGMGSAFQRGHEGPSLSLEQAFGGQKRVFLLNGWNGFITHLPLFERLLQQDDLDAWLITVMTTESAKVLAERMGSERILFVKPGGESLLALAVAHELLRRYPDAVDQDFLDQWADSESLQEYLTLAKSSIFTPEQVASLIVPEPAYEQRMLAGIYALAERLAQPDSVPIHIPGLDLIQSGGMAAYCLWSNLLALLGKCLGATAAKAKVRGGELRVLTEGNEESQLYGLGAEQFFGGLPVNEAGAQEAAQRMGLPDAAYAQVLKEPVRPILDFSEPNHSSQRELIVCIGTGLEARWLRDHVLWQERLRQHNTTLVVIDPMPGPFLLKHAALCIPTPPPVARHQLTQNGEWSLIPSYPRRQSPFELRSETTILYDAMAEISRSLREDADFRQGHPDLAELLDTGYLQARFEAPEWGWGGQLRRLGGEVSRRQLWERIQGYLGGEQPLTCQAQDQQGQALSWKQLMAEGITAAQSQQAAPFVDLHNQPTRFRFFVPQEADFALPSGVILNIGSSIPDPNIPAVRFAIASSATASSYWHEHLPANRVLYVSASLAAEQGLQNADRVELHHSDAESMICQVQVTDWLKGSMVYFHHYMTQAELDHQLVIPWLRFKVEACAYSQVPLLKKVQIHLSKEPQHG